MNYWCEREAAVAAAVRRGLLSEALREHLTACRPCQEASAAAELVRQAAVLEVASPLPAANLVWSRIQARRGELAMRQAARLMLWLRLVAAAYAVGLAIWFLLRFGLWRHTGFAEMMRPFENDVVVAGVLVAIASIAAGSLLLVRMGGETRRTAG